MIVTNLGELKEFLNKFTDNEMPIVIYRQDMEKSGNMPNLHIRVDTMKKTTASTYDAFDGTSYVYAHFINHPDGEPTLVIT
jgi:hypothetical protein